MGRENCAGPWPGALVFIPATSPGESATESAPPRENVQLSRFAIKITHTSGVMVVMVGQKGVGIILRGSRGPNLLPARDWINTALFRFPLSIPVFVQKREE